MKREHNARQAKYNEKGECLLGDVNSVSETDSPSFEAGELAWEASILTTELHPHRVYITARMDGCQ
jgi:hypothetical protein